MTGARNPPALASPVPCLVSRVPCLDAVPGGAGAPVLQYAAPTARYPERPAMALPTPTAELPRRIFSPIARGYDTPAQILGLFQYRRWHRFLLSRIPLSARPEPVLSEVEGTIEARGAHPTAPAEPACPEPSRRVEVRAARILDMATGTGALAFDLIRRPGVDVVAADITRAMLRQAQARAASARGGRASGGGADRGPQLVEATAEAPPFADASFDAVVFAYLLRYVADVPATLTGLARLLRPGGTMASLDFAVPTGAAYPLWRIHTDAVLPLAGALLSPGWRRIGAFLGPSIRDFYRRWPEPKLLDAWRDAGFADVQSRRLSLGGALVIWGRKGE